MRLEDLAGSPQAHPADRVGADLQLSINRALMNRLEALERRVKELEHRQPV